MPLGTIAIIYRSGQYGLKVNLMPINDYLVITSTLNESGAMLRRDIVGYSTKSAVK